MTLERTEQPLHIPKIEAVPEAVKCDYFDVSRTDGEQPRFVLQPHNDGGRPAGPALILEMEGARALLQHLEAILRDPTAA